MRLAIATCAALPQLDDDGPALLAALAARGVVAEPAVWTDAAVEWGRFDAVVIRSTWDYAPRRDAFVAWAERVEAETRLVNPASVVRWNTDKRYLAQLAAAGAPTVPLTVVESLDALRLPSDGEFVIKPTISAGSLDTARFGPGEHDGARLSPAEATDLMRKQAPVIAASLSANCPGAVIPARLATLQ